MVMKIITNNASLLEYKMTKIVENPVYNRFVIITIILFIVYILLFSFNYVYQIS